MLVGFDCGLFGVVADVPVCYGLGRAKIHLVKMSPLVAHDDVAHHQPPAFPAMNLSNVSSVGSSSSSAASQRDGARSG